MNRLRIFPAALLVVIVVLLSPVAGWADTRGSGTVSYAPTDEVIANPERGLSHYTSTHFRGDARGDAPLDEERLRAWRTQERITLAWRVFYLDDYRSRPLPAQTLESIAADLAAARRAGIKLVVRFAYSEDSDDDAPVDVVVGHVRQLAPLLNAQAGVVAFLQAGFVGRWGEWYYSRHYAHDANRPWDLSDTDWQARKTVLDTLLREVSVQVPLQLRYVSAHRRLVAPADSGRVGVHDDCFLASDTDHGTFVDDTERNLLANLSTKAPVGGETCAVNGTRSQWESAQRDMSTYHWTYLNADYHRDVLASWGTGGYDTVNRRLGYRLRLVSSSLPQRVYRGGSVEVRFVVANDGYAAPVGERPAFVVLTRGTTRIPVQVPVDVRQFAPGQTREVRVRVPAPRGAGTWSAGLWLPDRHSSLRGDPAYAVRLANVGTWDAATGVNRLGGRVEVR